MEKKVKVENMEVSTSDLAAIIGKSPQWVRQLTRDGVINQIGRGKYKLSDAVQAFYKFKAGEGSDNNLNYNREKALLTRAKRKLEENKLMILEGKLHQAEDVKRVMTNMLATFRLRCLAMPTKLAPILEKKDLLFIQDEIKKEIYLALNELSNYDPEDFKPKDLEEFMASTDDEETREKNQKAKRKSKK